MGYEVSVSPDSPIVEVRFSGLLDMGIRREGMTAAAALLKRERAVGILVDVREAMIRDDEVPTDALSMVSFLESLGMPPGTRLAFIHPAPDERRRHLSRMAALKDLPLLYFPTEDEARAWLLRV